MSTQPMNSILRFAAVVGAVLLACPAAPAQLSTGGQSGPSRGSGVKPPPGSEHRTQGESGTDRCVIQKFIPNSSGDEDQIGRLMVRLDSGKSMNLELRKKDDLRISLGGKDVSLENLPNVLIPGLSASVAWGTDKQGSRKLKVVNGVTFEALAIEGQFTAVDKDGKDQAPVLRVRGKPANGQPWPAPERKKKKSGQEDASGRKQTIREKNLKIKIVEGISSLTTDDAAKGSLSPEDLQPDEKLSAEIIFGQKVCLLVSAKAKPSEEAAEADAEKAGDDKDKDKGKKKSGSD